MDHESKILICENFSKTPDLWLPIQIDNMQPTTTCSIDVRCDDDAIIEDMSVDYIIVVFIIGGQQSVLSL